MMSLGGSADPTPFSLAQVRALIAAAWRELTWGLHAVSREMRAWRRLAETIPDASIRDDALHSLDHKRGHADGAALFTILLRRRDGRLLALLVAYETMLDFLDNVSERHPTPSNGRQLHRALGDALDPARPLRDYYRYHSCRDDGGYLATLVNTCRSCCRTLPSFGSVQALVTQETRRALVLGINHDTDTVRRDRMLRAWAAREYPHETELTWFELSGAASASLVVHALLALAAKSGVTDAEVEEVYAAHWPWIALATTMLDSYVDQIDDSLNGSHSYIAHYPDSATAVGRLRQSIDRSFRAARQLQDGHRHTVIVGCMIALYLSKDSAQAPPLRATTGALASEAGPLVRLLLPILRVWRCTYSQTAA
jgi:tetraprenyl-beta-curcumene synthase